MINVDIMCLGGRVGIYWDADETWEDPGGERETPQQSGGGWVSHIFILCLFNIFHINTYVMLRKQ